MTTKPTPPTFLRAEWRKLALANYAIDPDILKPYVPAGTQLDLWRSSCYVSLVGFMFLNTKVLGVKVPYHINFEEVNLRFYVLREVGSELRRGVVFVREIVPRAALAWVANTLFKEHYQSMPMKHTWDVHANELNVSYEWKKRRWNRLQVRASNSPAHFADDSEASFITEHYWGYTQADANKTIEYAVEHPRWQVYPVTDYQIDVDFGLLYGQSFEFLSHAKPVSVFLAEGSEVSVSKAIRLT